jgi:hypothetical protein
MVPAGNDGGRPVIWPVIRPAVPRPAASWGGRRVYSRLSLPPVSEWDAIEQARIVELEDEDYR